MYNLAKNAKNLTNMRFGELLALYPIGQAKDHRVLWKCKCDCGNETIVCARELQRGDTKSCGCLFSKGETRIKEILQLLKYDYKTQIGFADFRTETGYKYRYCEA